MTTDRAAECWVWAADQLGKQISLEAKNASNHSTRDHCNQKESWS